MPILNRINLGNSIKTVFATKVIGVRSASSKCILTKVAYPDGTRIGILDQPTYDIISKVENRNEHKVIVYYINNKPLSAISRESIYSVVDYCIYLSMSRQRILNYMNIYPERVVRLKLDPKTMEVNAILSIYNHDNSEYEIDISLGSINSSYSAIVKFTSLKSISTVNSWRTTGVKANRENRWLNMGINITVETVSES